jgi:hypothetical protein
MFAIAVFIFLFLRSPIEVDLFYQFTVPSLLICLIWIYLKSPSNAKSAIRIRKPGGFVGTNRWREFGKLNARLRARFPGPAVSGRRTIDIRDYRK